MMWAALGSLAVVAGAVIFSHWLYGRSRYREGRESILQEQSERRSLRRAETRTSTYTARHQAAPWPGPDTDQLATTGELRKLAEDGELAEIERLNAGFMRVFDFIAWTRKQERAGVA